MSNKIKILLNILIISFIVTGISFAGPRKKLGTSAAPELLIPVGSVGTALGGSNLSYVTGMDAMYWNPAGLAQLNANTAEAMFSHMNYFADMSVDYFGGVAKLGSFGVLGVSVKSINIGEILETTTTQPEGTGTIFTPTYLVGTIGFGRQMTDKIRFGTNVKIISENVANVSATGMAFDFGLQYIGGASGLAFGIAIKNLGGSLTFNGPGLDNTTNANGITTATRVILQSFDLPTNLELGISYNAKLNKNNNLNISTAFLNSGFSTDEYKFGLEYNYNSMLFLRGSAIVNPDKEENESMFGPSFGAGIRYPFGTTILSFDYAYRVINQDNFNSTNQFFTLSVGF